MSKHISVILSRFGVDNKLTDQQFIAIFIFTAGLMSLFSRKEYTTYLFNLTTISFTIAALMITTCSLSQKLSKKSYNLIVEASRKFINSGAGLLIALIFSPKVDLAMEIIYFVFLFLGSLNFSFGLLALYGIPPKLMELKE
ncbi:MAG: hypothetical protein ABEJ83_04075 [Candidatus Nanohaloarchaea archaeon]